MTRKPRRDQNSSSAGLERRGADDEAQNFGPNARCTARYRHQRRATCSRPGGASVDAGNRAPDVLAQDVQDLRHRHEHRHAALLDLRDDVGRVEAAHEDDRAGQHRRDEGGHRLAEHVAERQQVQEPQREERPAVAPVLQHLALDRDDVGQHVAVGDDDALGLGRRARREDDLGDVVARRAGREARCADRASRGATGATRRCRRRGRACPSASARRHIVADQRDARARRCRRRAARTRATSGSRWGRRRRPRGRSPRTRRSTRAGSRPRRGPRRPCGAPPRAGGRRSRARRPPPRRSDSGGS